ncbi:MAG: histidinol-phosphate transaminase [Eubacteriales bacterium]
MIEKMVREHLLHFKNYSVPNNQYPYILNANENPYNIFEDIQDEVISKVLKYKPNVYPDAMAVGLRNQLAAYGEVQPDQILCGNGSDELISMILTTFVEKDAVVVTHVPTFDMYDIGTRIAQGKCITIQDNEEHQIDAKAIIDAVNKNNAKLLFLCVPNNPTGYAMPKDDILHILACTKECIVVIDEAYYEFYGISCIDLVDTYPNMIILRTLSKAFGLAGLRIGYALGSKEIIQWLYRVKQPYNLNSISQLLGDIVLQHRDIIHSYTEIIKRERDALHDHLCQIESLKVFQSSGNFLLVQTDDSERLNTHFLDTGILVKYYGDHPLLKNCFRITLGDPRTNQIVLNTIKEALI